MVTYNNSCIEIPNLDSIGSFNDYLLRNNHKIHCDFETYRERKRTDSEVAMISTSVQLPDFFEVLSVRKDLHCDYVSAISLKFGLLKMYVFKENILISDRLCKLISLKKFFDVAGIECRFVGDKPFLSFNK